MVKSYSIRQRLKIQLVRAARAAFPNLLSRLLARRASRSFEKAGVVFLHVPKSAGVSVSRKLYGKGVGHYTIEHLRRILTERALTLPIFTVTRNPWTRLYSAYRFAAAGGGTHGAIQNHAQYRTAAFASFDTFVSEWLSHQDLRNTDPVFRPQTTYLTPDGSTDAQTEFDHIGQIENLAKTEAWLSSTLGRTIRFPHLNVSSNECERTPVSSRTIARVQDLYADDFRILGYDTALPDSLSPPNATP